MQINLLGENMEITPAIHDYVVRRVTNLGKLLAEMEKRGGEAKILFEVGKSTKHHKRGEFFHSDCSIQIDGKNFYASVDREDLYDAIDSLKEKLFSEITKSKKRKQTLFYRGARRIKNVLKGLAPWRK
jgi:putative sigma-54 modulation protein